MNRKVKKMLFGTLAIGAAAAVCAATRQKDTVSLVLKENLTEGFLWKYTVENGSIVRECSSDYLPAFGESESGDSYGEHKWTFAPVAKGETLLHFQYTRPWETDEVPLVTATYRAVVDSDRKLQLILCDHSPNFPDYPLSVG